MSFPCSDELRNARNQTLTSVPVPVVPREKLGSRTVGFHPRQRDRPALPTQILLAIIVVGANFATDLHPVCRSYGDISPIKERVQITSQQETVIDAMLSSVRIRTYMRGLQDR